MISRQRCWCRVAGQWGDYAMPRPRRSQSQRPIEAYDHLGQERLNNPPVGLVSPDTDSDASHKTYEYDPHLDPQLQWAGKAEHTSFEVPTVSLHVHERIDPRTIIEATRKRNGAAPPVQGSLFDLPEENPPLRSAIEFYQHRHNWSNRLVAGDSLLVMNSLLKKEGMGGKVQMVYIDPPYGIRYGSNFQPFVNRRDVRDGRDEDLTQEPETIKAFRDTWELGIHSYLSYLRDRLLLARELLADNGSCFVQIGDENVHRVRAVMDEVFGEDNFIAEIKFKTTSNRTSEFVSLIFDSVLFYAKSRDSLKFRRQFRTKDYKEVTEDSYGCVEETPNSWRRLTRSEKDNPRQTETIGPLFGLSDLTSSHEYTREPFNWFNSSFGTKRRYWSTSHDGMTRLGKANRLCDVNGTLRYKRFFNDTSVFALDNIWSDLGSGSQTEERTYVVQTLARVIQRCILMATDPGDLVFDPTCGSGTTAYVAEQWGRRWITCDTSRVAITLAKRRLMTALFDYYKLAHPDEGVGSGFNYTTVPHITMESIANNPELDDLWETFQPKLESLRQEINSALGESWEEWEIPNECQDGWTGVATNLHSQWWKLRIARQKEIDAAIARHAPQATLYDQPLVDTGKRRVTGPFSIEAVPAPAAKPIDEIDAPEAMPADDTVGRSSETLRQSDWRDELLKTGIRGKAGQFIQFARLEPLPGCRYLHADGESLPNVEGAESVREGGAARAARRIVVSFGPDHAPLEQRQVEWAIQEAQTLVPRPRVVVFAAFQFDPEASKDIDETNWPGLTLLKVQMNADLLTEDLKRKRASNESFWLIGQPDVYLHHISKGHDTGKWQVEVRGFDYYNTKTGSVESGGEDKIAVWSLDTDYDGRSLYPRQVFFPMSGPNDGWSRLARNLKAEIDEDLIEAYRGAVSLPFEAGEHRRIAVKIVDDRGIESLKVVSMGG